MEQYRSAHSIPLHDLASFAQHNVTQIAQNTARMLDKAAERCIIVRSFVRSFVSTNCTPHATIQSFSSHDRHTGRNVCIAYGDARRYGFEKLYVPVQFFNSGLLCKLARPATFPHPCRGYTGQTPRKQSLAFYRFHTPFPYIRAHAKSFGTNVFLLCRYAFCTGRKRRRANNSAGIVWNLYEAYRFQLEFAVRQPSRAGTYFLFKLLTPHAQDGSTVPVRFFYFPPKRSHL